MEGIIILVILYGVFMYFLFNIKQKMDRTKETLVILKEALHQLKSKLKLSQDTLRSEGIEKVRLKRENDRLLRLIDEYNIKNYVDSKK